MMKNGVYFIRIALVSCILKVIVNFNSMETFAIFVLFSETLDQGPTLNFTPYENPMKKPINPPTLQADKNPAVTEERAKSQEIPKDKSQLKKRPKEKKLENPVSTEKLFTGKAMWGPGGYANDRARSGSVDSSNKSDSSSRSTGSEQAAVKTNSEVRASQFRFLP